MKGIGLLTLRGMAMRVTEEKGDCGGKASAPVPVATAGSSSLAALVSCREASGEIMEYEKAVLVTKEHDYVKGPELTQLAPLLKSAWPAKEEASTSDVGRKRPRKGSQKAELLSVINSLSLARESLLSNESGEASSHLTSMVSLQATLIHELQEQLHVREVETNTVRREKEQLEARLVRMERRLSVLQKRSRDKDRLVSPEPLTPPTAEVTTPTPTPTHTPATTRTRQTKHGSASRLTRLDDLANSSSRRQSRSRSSSVDGCASKLSSRLSTPSGLDITHRATRKNSDEINHSVKRPRVSQVSYFQTEFEYAGLDLSLQQQPLECVRPHPQARRKIKVPSWRERTVKGSLPRGSSVLEDLSDGAFAKRHNKHEMDEKRRKRWDAQRIREQIQSEQLRKRYMPKEGVVSEKKKEKFASFLPKAEELEEIEISDKICVSAFGRPLPVIKPSVFKLPGADFGKMMKGKGRGRLSFSSSTENATRSPSVDK